MHLLAADLGWGQSWVSAEAHPRSSLCGKSAFRAVRPFESTDRKASCQACWNVDWETHPAPTIAGFLCLWE